MAILGLGTDIVEVTRIQDALERQSGLAARLLTVTELEQFEQHQSPVRYLAKRFAAKEAALKALGTGLQQGMSWQMLEIIHDQLGKPELILSGKANERFTAIGGKRVLLSLSDERHYAQAVVVIDG